MTSAMPVQCSNQLSYEFTHLRAGQFVGLMFLDNVFLVFFAFGGPRKSIYFRQQFTCIIYCHAGPGYDYNCLQVQQIIFFSRVSYLPSYVFLRRRRRFSSRKLYACLEKFLCFLQLSDRAKFLELDVQGSFSLDSSITTGFEINCHCSAWFRQDHGFDPLYGSHQLPVYLKYSVRLKLLAQLVHS